MDINHLLHSSQKETLLKIEGWRVKEASESMLHILKRFASVVCFVFYPENQACFVRARSINLSKFGEHLHFVNPYASIRVVSNSKKDRGSFRGGKQTPEKTVVVSSFNFLGELQVLNKLVEYGKVESLVHFRSEKSKRNFCKATYYESGSLDELLSHRSFFTIDGLSAFTPIHATLRRYSDNCDQRIMKSFHSSNLKYDSSQASPHEIKQKAFYTQTIGMVPFNDIIEQREEKSIGTFPLLKCDSLEEKIQNKKVSMRTRDGGSFQVDKCKDTREKWGHLEVHQDNKKNSNRNNEPLKTRPLLNGYQLSTFDFKKCNKHQSIDQNYRINHQTEGVRKEQRKEVVHDNNDISRGVLHNKMNNTRCRLRCAEGSSESKTRKKERNYKVRDFENRVLSMVGSNDGRSASVGETREIFIPNIFKSKGNYIYNLLEIRISRRNQENASSLSKDFGTPVKKPTRGKSLSLERKKSSSEYDNIILFLDINCAHKKRSEVFRKTKVFPKIPNKTVLAKLSSCRQSYLSLEDPSEGVTVDEETRELLKEFQREEAKATNTDKEPTDLLISNFHFTNSTGGFSWEHLVFPFNNKQSGSHNLMPSKKKTSKQNFTNSPMCVQYFTIPGDGSSANQPF